MSARIRAARLGGNSANGRPLTLSFTAALLDILLVVVVAAMVVAKSGCDQKERN